MAENMAKAIKQADNKAKKSSGSKANNANAKSMQDGVRGGK